MLTKFTNLLKNRIIHYFYPSTTTYVPQGLIKLSNIDKDEHKGTTTLLKIFYNNTNRHIIFNIGQTKIKKCLIQRHVI